MESKILGRLDREMRSFYAIIIINIVGAGLAMSFGVAIGVTNLITILSEGRILLLQAALSVLALVGFGFAIRWLIFSAQIFDGFDDLRDEFKSLSGKADGETMTELIVQNMALYRNNKTAMDKLMLGSRVTGTFFLISGAASVIHLLTLGSTEPAGLLIAAFGTILCIALGIVGVFFPSFLKRYAQIWEQRLADSDEAEKRLKDILE